MIPTIIFFALNEKIEFMTELEERKKENLQQMKLNRKLERMGTI